MKTKTTSKAKQSKNAFLAVLGKVFLASLVVVYFFPVALVVDAPIANAATYTVDSTEDNDDGSCGDGDCTLREAFTASNASAGADVISIPAGTYTIATGGLDVDSDDPLTVTGAGEGSTIINFTSGGGRITVDTGAGPGGFALSDVTIQQNNLVQYVVGLDDTGGAAAYTGDFSITNTTFTTTGASVGIHIGSAATDGFDITGSVDISDNTFSGFIYSIYAGVGLQGSPSVPTTISGTLDIDGNTITADPTTGGGFNYSILVNGLSVAGTSSVDGNDFTIPGADSENAGIALVDFQDVDADFAGDLSISNNTINAEGFTGGITFGYVNSGTVTIDSNTINGFFPDVDAFLTGIGVLDFSCAMGGACDNPVDVVNISNNTLNISNDDGANGAPNGILVFAAAADVTDNTVTLADPEGNISPNGSAGIIVSHTDEDGGAGIDIDSVVSGNIVTGFSALGLVAAAAFDDQEADFAIFNNVVASGGAGNVIGMLTGAYPAFGPPPAGTTVTTYMYNNTLANVTLNGETADNPVGMGAASFGGTTTAYMFNNIIQGNATGIYPLEESGTVSITSDYNVLYNNDAEGGDNYNGATPGANDITEDASFVDEANDDFSIQGDSSALDAGADSGGSPAVDAPTVDIEGTSRPQRTGIDIGAYERTNAAPTSSGSTDQSVTLGEEVTLTCNLADPEDDLVTYEWSQTSGPTVTLSDNNATQPTFTPTEEGTYVFSCLVTDSFDAADTGTVTVTVGAASEDESSGEESTSGSTTSSETSSSGTLTAAGAPLSTLVVIASLLAGSWTVIRRRKKAFGQV